MNALGKQRRAGDSRLGESASSCSKFRNVSKGLADQKDPIIFTTPYWALNVNARRSVWLVLSLSVAFTFVAIFVKIDNFNLI